ncbi:hypothetical protein, partial [Acinetobacter oleivorans]|uniref:hypothetical protein n=1 Tax=Acinetobacter oleivorans TaxID=1148157 RepID=UPI00148F057F
GPLQLHEQSEHNCSVHRHIAYRANDRDFSYSPLQATKAIQCKNVPKKGGVKKPAKLAGLYWVSSESSGGAIPTMAAA